MNDSSIYMELNSNDLQIILNELLNKVRDKGFCPPSKTYNSLLELVEDLNSEQYLWLRNETNFKNILGRFCVFESVLLVNITNQATNEQSKPLTFSYPSLETKLDNVYFSSEFDKLILRILNGSKNNDHGLKITDHLSDIINLTKRDLLNIPGIGKKYVDLWLELKNIYEKTLIHNQ